jgi:Zn-dependent peptidase ImmA (M78 family)
MIRHKLIRQTALKLLEEAQISAPPVDLHVVAELAGATVVDEPFNDDAFSGFLLRSPGAKPVIGVNSDHPLNRKRFTLAHEIGHLMLHPRDGVHYDKQLVQLRHASTPSASDVEEIEANRFAAEILMPSHFLTKDVEEIGAKSMDDEMTLAQLAKKYKVSSQSMAIRLERLNLLDRA